MNFRKIPETSTRCRCCDECLQVKDAESDNNNFIFGKSSAEERTPHRGRSLSRDYPTSRRRRSSGLSCGSSGRNGNFYENYAVPDGEDVLRRQYPKSRGSANSSANRRDECVDSNTLHMLSNFRQRACRFIDSDGGWSECEDAEPYTRRRQSNVEDGLVTSKVRDFNYSPQCCLTKRMARQNERIAMMAPGPMCDCQDCTPGRDGYGGDSLCHCCRCRAKGHPPVGSETSARTGTSERLNLKYPMPIFRQRVTPNQDGVCDHEICGCFHAWRPSYSGEASDACQYEESDGENFTDCLNDDGGDEVPDSENGNDNEDRRKSRGRKGKSGHISRSHRRNRRSGNRKRKSKTRKESQSPLLDFEPSLKKPHPNSCDRCWRFASPSRSPVNKPSQRFDPNFRRSHSQINLNSNSRDALSARDRSPGSKEKDSGAEIDQETKVHNVMCAKQEPISRTKSAEIVKKVKIQRTESDKILKGKKSPRTKEVEGKSLLKRDDAGDDPCTSVRNRNPPSKTDMLRGNPNSNKNKQLTEVNKSSPIISSPSALNKSSPTNKPKKKISNVPRPSSDRSPPNGGGNERETKQRPSSACPTSQPKESPPSSRLRAHSLEKDRTCLDNLRDNLFTPFRDAKPCVYSPIPEEFKSIPPMNRDHQNYNRDRMVPDPAYQRNNCLGGSQRNSINEGQNFQKCGTRRNSKNGYDSGYRRISGVNDRGCCCRVCSSLKDQDLGSLVEAVAKGRARNNGFCKNNPIVLHSMEANAFNEMNSMKRNVLCSDSYERNGQRESRRNCSSNCDGQQNNPRKYCVFYMTRSKENDDNGVEVLIEELVDEKCRKGSGRQSLGDKMKRMSEHRADSMALRYQKGIPRKYNAENNRVLYF